MAVSLVNDGAALQSMRNSDFDAYSAMGEVIDNSIQAQAQTINVLLNYKTDAPEFEVLKSVVFTDDGAGMNKDVLHRCLQLGYSSRYNDRSGIGRFGVGAILAAIRLCKKIEIYSKDSSGQWLYTFIDLDLIIKDPPEMDGIPEPVVKLPPEGYKNLAEQDRGTIVIWSKFDMQEDSASQIADEFRVWVGRTYRHFIWEGVKIVINGAKVSAVDPLYSRTECTHFEDDPRAHEYEPIQILWPIPIEDRREGGPSESTIKIRMSLLPEKFRPTQGSGNSRDATERFIDQNEGVSIVRNGREVFYGPIPYWGKPHFSEIDRWWGCEISFDAVLDKAFTVKNIKRGALPLPELRRTLKGQILPTSLTALEKVREVWAKAKVAKLDEVRAGVRTPHQDAEEIAGDTPAPPNLIDADKDIEAEIKKFTDTVFQDADERIKAEKAHRFRSRDYSIEEKYWKGSEFVETNHLGGVDVLLYNARHAFFEELSEIKSHLSDTEDAELAQHLVTLIDLLLISYSKAEAMFEKGSKRTAEDFIEDLRAQWGNYLSSYIRTWRERRTEDG